MKLLAKDRNKKTPQKQTIHYDQEVLRQEIQELKIKLNQTSEENQMLKTKNINSDVEEVYKLIKIVSRKKLSRVDSKQGKTAPVDSDQMLFMIDLKRQNRDLKSKIGCLEEQIQDLLKSQKFQKNHELEIEIEEYQTELQRIKNMLLESLVLDNNMAEFLVHGKPKKMFRHLKRKNIEMAANIKELKKAVDNQKLVIQEQETNNQKIQLQNNKLKGELKQLQKELKEHQETFKLNKKENHQHCFEELKLEIRLKNSEIFELNSQNQAKEKKILELEKFLKEKIQDQNEQINNLRQELKKVKQAMTEKQSEISTLKSQVSIGKKSVFGGMRSVIYESGPSLSKILTETHNIKQSEENSSENVSSDEGSHHEIKAAAVHKLDVKDIGTRLKYTLRKENLDFNDIDKPKNIVESENYGKMISIKDLRDHFISYPFNLTVQEAFKLARYLVEETDEKIIVVDMNLTTPIQRVKSILRNLLNNYKLFPDEKTMISQFRQNIKNHRNMILNQIISSQDAQGVQERIYIQKDFFDSLTYSDCQLTSDQIDFLLQKNFYLTGSLHKFYYNDIIHFIIGDDKTN